MHDMRFIEARPELFDQCMKKRGIAICAKDIISLNINLKEAKTKLQALQERRNSIAKAIGIAATNNTSLEKKAALMTETGPLASQIECAEMEVEKVNTKLESILISLPNILDDMVPLGDDESQNVIVKTHGTPPVFSFSPKQHFELGIELAQMDFVQSVKMSGSRFVMLRGPLARLERALANFMLEVHTTEFGYTEISPPLMVKDHAMFGVGQLPKFAIDSFSVSGGYRLIPTAEVPLTSIVAGSILEEKQLPLRFTACTPCFRSEAGSAGRDTRGMIRAHQFIKVELVSITSTEGSKAEQQRMLEAAETIMQKLGIPYRIALLCSSDTGFCSSMTYDIEAWLPGQKRYREISSCSNCTDFQARRMQAYYRPFNSKLKRHVHTLNCSGLAVGRALIAVMENYQQEDGTVAIPPILQSYMGGKTKIEKIEDRWI